MANPEEPQTTHAIGEPPRRCLLSTEEQLRLRLSLIGVPVNRIRETLANINPDANWKRNRLVLQELKWGISHLGDVLHQKPWAATKAASSFSLDEACTLLDIDNRAGVEEDTFVMPGGNREGKAPRGTDFLDDLLQRNRNSTTWVLAHDKSKVRMAVNMVLFDRMEHAYEKMHDDADGTMKDEDGVKWLYDEVFCCSVPAADPEHIINGTVDYVFGHQKSFTGLVDVLAGIVIRTPSQALPELVCYLASVQYGRIAESKAITPVYGIATDSETYQFVRLDEECVLTVSESLRMPQECEEIYHWIDSILAADTYQPAPNQSELHPDWPLNEINIGSSDSS